MLKLRGSNDSIMSGISVYEITTNLNMHSLFTLLLLLLLVLFLDLCLVSLNDDDSTTHTSSAEGCSGMITYKD